MTLYLRDYLSTRECLVKCQHLPYESGEEASQNPDPIFMATGIPDETTLFISKAVNITLYQKGQDCFTALYVDLDGISFAYPAFIDRFVDLVIKAPKKIEELFSIEGEAAYPVVLGSVSTHLESAIKDKMELKKQNLWIRDHEGNLKLIGAKLPNQAREVFGVIYDLKSADPHTIGEKLNWTNSTKKQAVSTYLKRIYDAGLLWRRQITKLSCDNYRSNGAWTYEYLIPVIQEENSLPQEESQPQ